eukprot:5151349-Amphidinium_carterae.1
MDGALSPRLHLCAAMHPSSRATKDYFLSVLNRTCCKELHVLRRDLRGCAGGQRIMMSHHVRLHESAFILAQHQPPKSNPPT